MYYPRHIIRKPARVSLHPVAHGVGCFGADGLAVDALFELAESALNEMPM